MTDSQTSTQISNHDESQAASPSMLIIGHSHVLCLKSYPSSLDHKNVSVIHLRTVLNAQNEFDQKEQLRAELATARQKANPDHVCLCIAGNLHHRLGTLEHPTPFTVGHIGDLTRSASGRRLIPYQVMMQLIQHQMKAWLKMADFIYETFPNSARIYFNSPPPLLSWDHIQNAPGQFEELLHLGPAPTAMRRQLYEMQTEVLQHYADSRTARFIHAPAAAVDSDGFLNLKYAGNDPTHANKEYGELLYASIVKATEIAE